MNSIFFDSYALVELFCGNLNYEKFRDIKVVTSYFHLYETCFILRKKYSVEEISNYLNKLKKFCVQLDFDWINEAVELRHELKNRDLSYADCLGYIIAKNMGIKFLTGDSQFKDLKNVEFVK